MTTKQLAKQLGLIRRSSKLSLNCKNASSPKSKQFFQYLIIIDFESTCWKDTKHYGQEIIEFPAVLLNTSSGEIESEFHTYVQPQEHPILSEFCTELTGIKQQQVDDGVPLRICLSQFSNWIQKLQNERGIIFPNVFPNQSCSEQKMCAFVTWSDIALSAPSQAVKEEFSIAAGQLRKETSEVRFAQVDITQEKELGKEYTIQEFPTFKLFINGDRKQPIDCKGVRTAAAFVTWINRRIGQSYVLLNTTEHYESFIQSDKVSVVGFFKDLNSNLTKHFAEAAKDVPEFPFGFVSNEEILTNVGITGNMVAIYKKEKPVHYLISEEEIKKKVDLIRSIRIYIMDVVTEYNLETSVTIFDVPVDSHVLLFTSKTSENFNTMYESYESAALQFRGQMVFVLVDTDEPRNGRLFEYFRITEVDTPAVRILNLTSDTKYRMPADDVTFENVRSFCQRYLDGKAKPQKNSDEIPSDWDTHPVKVLVGKNFNEVAFNKSNNAFVMFYAPWNKESQELLPVWEDLGKRHMNNTNVTIARIDCTANDIQLIVLDRYPFFRFFPAGSDNKSVRYTGDKTIEAFTKFLENELESSNIKEEDSSESRPSSSEDDTKKIKEEL